MASIIRIGFPVKEACYAHVTGYTSGLGAPGGSGHGQPAGEATAAPTGTAGTQASSGIRAGASQAGLRLPAGRLQLHRMKVKAVGRTSDLTEGV